MLCAEVPSSAANTLNTRRQAVQTGHMGLVVPMLEPGVCRHLPEGTLLAGASSRPFREPHLQHKWLATNPLIGCFLVGGHEPVLFCLINRYAQDLYIQTQSPPPGVA